MKVLIQIEGTQGCGKSRLIHKLWDAVKEEYDISSPSFRTYTSSESFKSTEVSEFLVFEKEKKK